MTEPTQTLIIRTLSNGNGLLQTICYGSISLATHHGMLRILEKPGGPATSSMN
jgi:hypothetical protein